MSDVKRYHVTDAGLVEGQALGRINVVLGADHDRVTAERDALQQRLTAADERADVLEGLLRDINDAPGGSQFKKHIDAALNPAPGEPDRINGMIETVGGEYAVIIDRANSHYGWTFKKHPDGQWVSGRKATEREMIAARSHAQNTKQL
ncbi:hypothetical protein [Pseudomonas sp. PSPC2-3]|uniref:hypothetical protein n=1 Tax=Pseudomonas sp. PSPC2-3 TaxID=2804561 RepID=UPI00204A125E|nr:MAG TPA: hypothetical protein [Caudoviricetes sp.]